MPKDELVAVLYCSNTFVSVEARLLQAPGPCSVSTRVPSPFWMASSTGTRTGATVTVTTGASTVKGATGSDLQVGRWFYSQYSPASEVAFSSLTLG